MVIYQFEDFEVGLDGLQTTRTIRKTDRKMESRGSAKSHSSHLIGGLSNRLNQVQTGDWYLKKLPLIGAFKKGCKR